MENFSTKVNFKNAVIHMIKIINGEKYLIHTDRATGAKIIISFSGLTIRAEIVETNNFPEGSDDYYNKLIEDYLKIKE